MRRILGPLVFSLLLITIGAPASAEIESAPVRVSGPTPFVANCNGAPQPGTLYSNAEVEPFVSADPTDSRHLVSVWQQDRWSNGGTQGNLTAVSNDRGRSWQRFNSPPFSRCAGGNAANGGDYERASDPWVSISPDGTVHQAALVENVSADSTNAIVVSSSHDGGKTWGPIKTLQRDTVANFGNDKESITADPTDSRFVYAVWDRLQLQNPDDPATPFSGDTLFARSTDGGNTWEPARPILDFPDNNGFQTIGNQIVVLGDGSLVNFFSYVDGRGDVNIFTAAIQRSTDKGATWSDPIFIDTMQSSRSFGQRVIDPADGHRVRTGDVSPDVAADPRKGSKNLYVTWQDARFTPAGSSTKRDQVVMSSSTDGGLTWSAPKRVSSNNNVQAFTSAVEVNKDGIVGVTYYDFTNDNPAVLDTLETDYWATTSGNGGRTFTPRERITRSSFNMRTAPDAGGFFVGDYEGLVSTSDGRFIPVFVLANSGNIDNRTDVFSTSVRRNQEDSAEPLSDSPQKQAPVTGASNDKGPIFLR